MRQISQQLTFALLAITVSGCTARWCRLPDELAEGLDQCEIARAIRNVCSSGSASPSCGDGVSCGTGIDCGSLVRVSPVRVIDKAVEDKAVEDESVEIKAVEIAEIGELPPVLLSRIRVLRAQRPPSPRIRRGPPPISYQPPMPPKFLPVPTRSVFANVNMHAPTASTGTVEVDYGSQLRTK